MNYSSHVMQTITRCCKTSSLTHHFAYN